MLNELYFCPVDFHLETQFRDLLTELEPEFGPLDLQALIFIIGVQELGHDHREFKKDEKVNIMHIAVCTLLSPFGFYEYEGRDKDDWPHFKVLKELPNLNQREQEHLMKEAILVYFNKA
jgi:hypothetical protein